jgi:hypothetical protein
MESTDEEMLAANELDLFSYDAYESSKIQVIDDPRSFDSLREAFHHLPLGFVTRVWFTQNSWVGSFDILSTLRLCDHYSFNLTLICDPAADPTSWPSLQVAYPRHFPSAQPRSRSNSDGSFLLLRNSDLDSNHEVVSLSDSSLSGFSWHLYSPLGPQKQICDADETHSETSWEMLPDDEDPVDQQSAPLSADEISVITMPPQSITSRVFSYKDALLAGGVDSIPFTRPVSNFHLPDSFCRLTTIFAQPIGEEPYVSDSEDDTYVDWLETALGSKETSISLINRGRLHSVKVSHERKKKALTSRYTRKHAR